MASKRAASDAEQPEAKRRKVETADHAFDPAARAKVAMESETRSPARDRKSAEDGAEDTEDEKKPEGTSFYFFDCDDNILCLGTKIYLKSTKEGDHTEYPFSSGTFKKALEDKTHEKLPDNRSFRCFCDDENPDIFLDDLKAAIAAGGDGWKGPAWNVLVYALQQERPFAIITARGHAPDSIKRGITYLVEQQLLPKQPRYVGAGVYTTDSPETWARLHIGRHTPEGERKQKALEDAVESGLEQYGRDRTHRFGMSDDSHTNIRALIASMRKLKEKYDDHRFFVVDTAPEQQAKLEVFPFDYSVAGERSRKTPKGLRRHSSRELIPSRLSGAHCPSPERT